MLGIFRAVLNMIKKIMRFLSHSLAWLWSLGFSRTGRGPGAVPGLAAFEEAASDAHLSEEDCFKNSQIQEQISRFANQVREAALRMALAWPNHRLQSEAESGLPVAVQKWLCSKTRQELENVAIMSDEGIMQLFAWLKAPSRDSDFSARTTSLLHDTRIESEQQVSPISFISAPSINAGINAANDIGDICDQDNAHPRRMAALGR
jgi:hypothetical protein